MTDPNTFHPRLANITVIDAMMGMGKSTWMINHMNAQYSPFYADAKAAGQPVSHHKAVPRYLVVVPSLAEVDRYRESCGLLAFKDPQPIHGRKLYHLNKLIEDRENIITTHALFKLMDRETYGLLRAAGYTLVIDEVLECVSQYALTKPDLNMLLATGMVSIEETTHKLCWSPAYADYKGKFEKVKNLCENGALAVYGRGTDKQKVIMWEFPVDFLECFDAVWILSYLFEGSPMAAYLKAERCIYSTVSVDRKSMEDGELLFMEDVDEGEIKAKLRELVTIYEGKANDIGSPKAGKREHPLSSSWFKRQPETVLKKMQGSTMNFFKEVSGTPSALNGWTTFKEQQSKLSGKGYARGFIPCNAKGTNDYADKASMAYLCNIFFDPLSRQYFEQERGIKISDDVFALSEMIQWIWRSRIRKDEPIHLYVPSERMRGLLKTWLESNNSIELIAKLGEKEAA